jgi:CheY-like chemotaxis protein
MAPQSTAHSSWHTAGSKNTEAQALRRLHVKHLNQVNTPDSVPSSKRPATPARPEEHSTGRASLRHSPELILVVDDDQNIRDSLAEVLLSENYAVRLAADGREAVRQFLQGPPDLILLDLNMPDINGWQAFQIMAELYPYVPVIFITARASEAVRAAQPDISVLMEKPLDIPSLLDTIRQLLALPDTARFARALRARRTKDQEDSQD